MHSFYEYSLSQDKKKAVTYHKIIPIPNIYIHNERGMIAKLNEFKSIRLGYYILEYDIKTNMSYVLIVERKYVPKICIKQIEPKYVEQICDTHRDCWMFFSH